ncbi:response regulator [Synechococcus sp. PCC 7336]|uniref:ATP-binding response regulator n=1 Tax=Synechococcus sp. PCC 7336 TaxID=195250 RepID=UPI00034B0211|nr:response regulator [Synechococcus sp. PCC 7336]
MAKFLKLLIVDDDEVDRMAILRAIARSSLKADCDEARNGAEAVAAIEAEDYNCVFLDYRLPDTDGLSLVKDIRQADVKIPLIVLTGQGDEQIAVDLMKAGASDYLTKSKVSPESLVLLVRNSIRLYEAERKTELASRQLHESNELLRRQNQELETQRQKIHLQNQQLIAATRLKDEFLANMSHELRTPLNAIIGMTEGLQELIYGELNPSQLKALQTVDRSATHLLALINDILDIAKIEAGQVKLELELTPIGPLCSASLAFIKQQALQKQIQIDIELSRNLPEMLVDRRRIQQALINLLTNAVKFTPESGRIKLEVSLSSLPVSSARDRMEVTCNHFVEISVRDTGIGIAQEHIGNLFKPFQQIDSALNRKYNGTGLGLAMVKSLVELHGGEVIVSSKVGAGSRFAIKLPYTPVREGESQAILPTTKPVCKQSSPEHCLVLLVEDNEANICTMSSYLEAKGYDLLLARSGWEAIELVQEETPDAILMDIQMPNMDGLETIQYIRQKLQMTAVPIIALTALAMPGDKERCMEAGANEYLSKPVQLRKLATIINSFQTGR